MGDCGHGNLDVINREKTLTSTYYGDKLRISLSFRVGR